MGPAQGKRSDDTPAHPEAMGSRPESPTRKKPGTAVSDIQDRPGNREGHSGGTFPLPLPVGRTQMTFGYQVRWRSARR